MAKFEATKEFYLANMGKKMRVGRTPVAEIGSIRLSGQSGSYERGFKFHESEWAMLRRSRKIGKHYVKTEFSMDHGKTWHRTTMEARKSKGRLKLNGNTRKEFAFDSIQRINRDYYGPGYTWKA